MGNNNPNQPLLVKQSSKIKQTELTESQQIEEVGQGVQTQEISCFCCLKNKDRVIKMDWSGRFITNCELIEQEYEWGTHLIEIVKLNDFSKAKYYREINVLKTEKNKVSQPLKEVPTPEEIENFKKNLKKSVIMSFGPSKLNESSKIHNPIESNVRRSKIEINRYSKHPLNNRSSILFEKSISNLSRQDMKKSFISFVEDRKQEIKIDPTLKSTVKELDVFMKFSNILERHMADTNCILGLVKSQYIKYFIHKFKDSAITNENIGQLVDSVKQFLTILKEAVMDYYNLQSFGAISNKQPINMFIANQENILSSCTAIIFKDQHFYTTIFNCIFSYHREQEEKFSKILEYLKGSGPERFTVKDKFCLNQRTLKAYLNQMSAQSGASNIVENIEIEDSPLQNTQPFKFCLDSLKQVIKSRTPVNKMKCIMACSEGITRQIERFYDVNGLKKEKWMLDADQVLSIFAYIIVAARVEHLHTQLFILDNFATGLQMMASTGYYLSVINCAVEHLEIQFALD